TYASTAPWSAAWPEGLLTRSTSSGAGCDQREGGAMPPSAPPQRRLSPAAGPGRHRAFSGSSLPGFSGPGFGGSPIVNQPTLAGFLNVGCRSAPSTATLE